MLILIQNAELSSTQRQLNQAQQATKARRQSTASPPELTEQLASKTSTIESLELELSNLRNQLNISQSNITSHEATIKELEQRATSAEEATETARKELDTFKESIQNADTEKSKSEDEDPAALQQRITVLESDLRTAQSSADTAAQRATSLEQKIETLTKLHKEAAAASANREKEIKDLKTRLKGAPTDSRKSIDAGDDLSDLEDEERSKLHTRIRELEAENFDLRRGVWREKRQALQPDIHGSEGETSPAYEDIDLNTPYGAQKARQQLPGRGSSFQDVLASGISAFTGRDRKRSIEQQPYGAHGRKQSLSLLSEDAFDEDAFRLAQEEEAKRRVERIREVKRGLEQWRGFRVDLVDLRKGGLGGGAATGPVFDV